MEKLDDVITKLTRYLLIIGMVIMVVLVFTQVVTRYFVGNTPFFIEETSRGMLIWVSLLGASLALRRGQHIGVEFFVKKLPEKIQPFINALAIMFVFGFLLFFLYASFKYSIKQTGLSSATLPISMFWFYLALPVGGFLMILQLIFSLNEGRKK